jgi:4-amino-4-deoxy-L-arabinose transferase-like glycosyltransferase
LFFTGLDAPLLEPQESRYAEIARELLEAPDWVVPHLNGQPYLDKPPLMYWLSALSYQLFGVSDFSARLIPSLAAFATVLIVFFWGKSIGGRELGFTAAAILALTPQFVYRGRWLSFDSLLCLWVTLSLSTAHVAATSRRFWPLWLVSAAAAGLGLLTKGPVAFVLVGVPLYAARWLWSWPLSIRRWLVWTGVAVGVAAGWFVAMSQRQDGFVEYFFWKHHVERYVTPFDHQKPFWFYIPELVFGLLPLVVLLPKLLKWCSQGQPGGNNTQREAACFAGLTALWCVAFFSLSGSKRATYILPCFPPLALALGLYLTTQLSRKAYLWWCKCGLMTLLVLLALLIFWWPFYTHKFSMRDAIEPARKHLSEDTSVLCYPRMWDGVPYYLRRSDVRAYRSEELTYMIEDIQRTARALLVVKPAQVREVLEVLPETRIAIEIARNSEVVVLLVSSKLENP